MIFKIHLLAFTNDEIREVEVPGDKTLVENTQKMLGLIFHYGQNDFQPKNKPSVSVGDVIEYNNSLFVIKAIGFAKMTRREFDEYKNLPQETRVLKNLFQ